MTEHDIPITKIMAIDIRESVLRLESYYGVVFPPAPAGLYLPGHHKPIIEPGKTYYYQGDKTLVKSVNTMDLVGKIVYDHLLHPIIPARASRTLVPFPDVHPAAVNIVLRYIRHLMDKMSIWTGEGLHGIPTDLALMEIIREECPNVNNPAFGLDVAIMAENIQLMLRSMSSTITSWLGNDPWIMHFFKHKGLEVHIEKSIDYRIYRWELEHGEAFRRQSGV